MYIYTHMHTHTHALHTQNIHTHTSERHMHALRRTHNHTNVPTDSHRLILSHLIFSRSHSFVGFLHYSQINSRSLALQSNKAKYIPHKLNQFKRIVNLHTTFLQTLGSLLKSAFPLAANKHRPALAWLLRYYLIPAPSSSGRIVTVCHNFAMVLCMRLQTNG